MLLQLDLKTTSANLKVLIKNIEIKLSEFQINEESVYLSEIRSDAYLITVEYFVRVIAISEFNELKQQINIAVLEVLEHMGVGMAGRDKILAASRLD